LAALARLPATFAAPEPGDGKANDVIVRIPDQIRHLGRDAFSHGQPAQDLAFERDAIQALLAPGSEKGLVTRAKETRKPSASRIIAARIHCGSSLIEDRFRMMARLLLLFENTFELKTPPRAPLANAHCERLNGTIRREFLDHVIPLSEEHLRRLLREWTDHYNGGRPHASLGPRLPDPHQDLPVDPLTKRHQLPSESTIFSKPILGGLHHEYRLDYTHAPT
jgi:hypothetical protein